MTAPEKARLPLRKTASGEQTDALKHIGLHVRGTIQTDDGELIFISYNGARLCPKEIQERFVKGEVVLKADECLSLSETQSG